MRRRCHDELDIPCLRGFGGARGTRRLRGNQFSELGSFWSFWFLSCCYFPPNTAAFGSVWFGKFYIFQYFKKEAQPLIHIFTQAVCATRSQMMCLAIYAQYLKNQYNKRYQRAPKGALLYLYETARRYMVIVPTPF